MLYSSRDKFKGLSEAAGKLFSLIPLSPNAWTLLSLIPASATLYLMANRYYVYALATYALTAMADVIDGAVARATNKTTKKGAYLDTMVDRIIEFMIIYGFFLSPMSGYYLSLYEWSLVLLFGSLFSTYAKAASVEKGLSSDGIKGGVMEHSDRMVVYFIIIALLAFHENFWASYALITVSVLSVVTGAQRAIKALRT